MPGPLAAPPNIRTPEGHRACGWGPPSSLLGVHQAWACLLKVWPDSARPPSLYGVGPPEGSPRMQLRAFSTSYMLGPLSAPWGLAWGCTWFARCWPVYPELSVVSSDSFSICGKPVPSDKAMSSQKEPVLAPAKGVCGPQVLQLHWSPRTHGAPCPGPGRPSDPSTHLKATPGGSPSCPHHRPLSTLPLSRQLRGAGGCWACSPAALLQKHVRDPGSRSPQLAAETRGPVCRSADSVLTSASGGRPRRRLGLRLEFDQSRSRALGDRVCVRPAHLLESVSAQGVRPASSPPRASVSPLVQILTGLTHSPSPVRGWSSAEASHVLTETARAWVMGCG